MSSKSSKSDSPSSVPELITVGRVRKPHGVRGEVLVDVLSDVEGRFVAGSTVEMVWPTGRRQSACISSVRGSKTNVIVLFEGFESREQAEELRSAALEVDRTRVPSAPRGAFYFFELVGCDCFDEHLGELGRVSQVLEDGGGLILEVSTVGSNLLVPFVESYLKEVDVANRRIDLELPEGLIESCTSES